MTAPNMKPSALSIGLAVFLVFALARAIAGVQDDVDTCREAIEASDRIDASLCRMKFSYIRGARVRVVGFRLYPVDSETDRLTALCTIERDAVTELTFETRQ